MKRTLLLVVVLLFVRHTSGYAQDYKKSIEKRFGDFYTLTMKGEVEKSMDYIPEEFFTVFPKQQIVAAMKQLLNAKDFEYKITGWQIKNIKEPKEVGGKFYSLLGYSSILTMKFHELEGEQLALAKLSLLNTFGADHVKLDEKTNVFTINAYKKSCAISSNGMDGWKFINIEPKQRLLLDKILPKEILEEL